MKAYDTQIIQNRNTPKQTKLQLLQSLNATKIEFVDDNNFTNKSPLTGHWMPEQNIKYYIFLKEKRNNFEKKSLRRSQKIFKEMSSFLKTRTADQCRSHHQKMEKKYNSLSSVLYFLHQSYPLDSYYEQTLIKQCLNNNEIMFQTDSSNKNQQQTQKHSDKQQENSTNQSQNMLIDMSKYLQNGYYVMPLFIVPCSQQIFKSIWYLQQLQNFQNLDVLSKQ